MAKKAKAEVSSHSLAAMIEAIKKSNQDAIVGAPLVRTGVPVPLPLQWLLDSNVLWFGITYCVAGEKETQKSGLAHELIRLVHQHDSRTTGILIEAEGEKYNPLYAKSILGDKCEEWYMPILGQESVEDVQRVLTAALRHRREANSAEGPVPFCVILDSLSGQTTEDDVESIGKVGYAERGYATEALSWSKYFKYLSGQLNKAGPVLFVYVNHEKLRPAVRPGLPPERTRPGGKAPEFYAGFIISTRVVKRDEDLQELRIDGKSTKFPHIRRNIRLVNTKNSMGINDREIDVPFVVHRNTADFRQVSYFDWDAALAKLLINLVDPKYSARGVDRIALRNLLGLDYAGNRYSSKKLKVSDVTDYELGALINKNQEVLEELFKTLRLQRMPVWNVDPDALACAKVVPVDKSSDDDIDYDAILEE